MHTKGKFLFETVLKVSNRHDPTPTKLKWDDVDEDEKLVWQELATEVGAKIVEDALHEVNKELRIRKGWAYAVQDMEDLWMQCFDTCIGAVDKVRKDLLYGKKE